MSFAQDDHNILGCELWDEPYLYANILGIPDDGATMEDWQVVPTSVAAFSDWAMIYHNKKAADRSRTKLLIYRNPPATHIGSVYPVQLRLQGFIRRHNLQPLGSWRGAADRANAAIQTIVLGHGGMESHHEAWATVIRAVDNTKTFVARSFGIQSDGQHPIPPAERELYLQRRVFTKVRGTNTGPSVLRDGDDPFGLCAAVETQWRVTKGLTMARVMADENDQSRVGPCDHTAFANGDFVDVGVVVDIAVYGGGRGMPRVDIHLGFQHVLLLHAATVQEPHVSTQAEVNIIEQALVFN